jgi:hypothetical protein
MQMKVAGLVSGVCGALLALVAAVPAGASEIVTRNATGIALHTDDHGRAMVSYFQRGRMWHAFYSGAVNARSPSQTVRQVKFKVDYSGGRGKWKHFKNTCRPYDGPKLAWFLAGCKASDGSYWALQMWQRMLPNVGYVPWTHGQKVWEVHVSHWTGEIAQLDAYADWVYAGRFHEVFGRATYRGQPIFGFKTTKSGNPLDTHGRLIFLDTFDSAYGAGWRRENSFVAHNPSGMFCYGLYPYSSYGSYPSQRSVKLTGKGKKYRLTLYGPGVTPDVTTYVDGLPDYDRKNPSLFDWETEMTSKVKDMAAESGDRLCGHH